MRGEILVVPTSASINMLKKSAQVLAKYMIKSGIEVNEQISLCPDRKRLQHAISKALDRSEVIFTLGGMGKDSGFLAKQVVSEGLRLPLENSNEALVAIREYSTRTGIASSANDVTLASLPSGSRPLIPAHGVIPGCIISSPTQHIVMLPENSEELVPMLTRQVFPILSKVGLSAESNHEMHTFGASEEQVRQLIMDLMGTRNPVVTTRSQGDEVIVKVAASAANSTEAVNLSGPVLRSIANRLGDYAYGLDVPNLETSLVQKMTKKGLTLAIAESGTAGNTISRISKVDPNGAVLIGGTVVDNADDKISNLGLRKKDLRKKGEVSEFTAVSMAHAVKQSINSDIGVGIVGNLPDYSKGNDSIVYIAVCDNKYVYIKKILVEKNDGANLSSIVSTAISRAINMARLFVDYHPEPYTGSVPLSKALAGKLNVTDQDSYDDVADFGDDVPEFQYNDSDDPPKKSKKKKKLRSKSTNKSKNNANNNDNKNGKIRKIILILATIVFLAGAGYRVLYQVQSIFARNLRDNLSAVYDTTGFNGLKSLNSDTVAFVSLDGTTMRYPIVQSDDNQYYLRRDFNKKSNNHGIPFMDYQSDPKKPSDNLIVYGHNMRDGQIFGELLKYKDLEYYKENPIIEFDTLKKKGEYKVFSIFITSANPKHFDDGKLFEYHKFIDSESDEEYSKFIDQVRIRSLLEIPVEVEPGDEIITLSTCDYDFSDSRFVVMARRVRSDESSTVDVASASHNPTPLYPDIWHEMYGGIKPTANDSSWEPDSSTTEDTSEESKDIPTSAAVTPIEKTESSAESSQVSAESSTASQPDKVAEDKKKADEEAAAKKAAEDKKKAEEEAAAKKATEDKKKAEEEAAAKKAEEDKKKADEEAAAKKAGEDKKKAEEEANAQISVAKLASEDAASYQRSALNSSSKSEAEAHAESAKASAAKAEEAAAKAKTAAGIAGTDQAKQAADETESYASDARQSANTAAENAKNLSDAVDGQSAKIAQPFAAPVTTGGAESISSGSLKVKSSASFTAGDDLDILSKIVQQEVGASFSTEAIKAQAVASYSYILNSNKRGVTPEVYMANSSSEKVRGAVSEVLGQAVYYDGAVAYTTYHATSAGVTTNSSSVWGGHHPYLVSVDSSVDSSVRGYRVDTSMSSDEVARRISDKLGIEASGDPSEWFEVLSYVDDQYNGEMSVCGNTRSKKTGSILTGRLVREIVLNLRSSSFEVNYDPSSDTFTFTTYGFGHGVGMSQNGANSYAKQGWSYVEILEHYFPGTYVG